MELLSLLLLLLSLLPLLSATASPASRQTKLVLFWTMNWFPYEVQFPVAALRQPRCPLPCRFTAQRQQADLSDVTVFHAFFLNMTDLPARRPHQRWALWSLEPVPHRPTTMDDHPTDGVFNWTISYQSTSDVTVQPFSLAPVDARYPYASAETGAHSCAHTAPWRRPRACPRPDNEPLKRKTKLVAWFVSNCALGGGRFEYVSELQRYIAVDIYGACGDRTCGEPGTPDADCYRMLERDYLFYLAFENSLCAEYATEKLFNVLRLNVVPVVFGTAGYRRLAPPGAVIDALTLAPRQLALRLAHLAAEPAAYLAHLRWKHALVPVHDPAAWACELCRKAHGGGSRRWAEEAAAGPTAQAEAGGRRDVMNWHSLLGRCQRYDGGGELSALFW